MKAIHGRVLELALKVWNDPNNSNNPVYIYKKLSQDLVEGAILIFLRPLQPFT